MDGILGGSNVHLGVGRKEGFTLLTMVGFVDELCIGRQDRNMVGLEEILRVGNLVGDLDGRNVLREDGRRVGLTLIRIVGLLDCFCVGFLVKRNDGLFVRFDDGFRVVFMGGWEGIRVFRTENRKDGRILFSAVGRIDGFRVDSSEFVLVGNIEFL